MRLSRRTHNIILGVTIAVFFLSPVSCDRGKQVAERKAIQPVNPYTDDSVFAEVKEKLQKNPNDADALYHMADLYERSGQYSEAIESYKKVVRLKPDMGYAYFKIGTSYDRLNQPAEAIRAFKQAVKYMPRYAVLYNNLGIAYGNLGKPDEEAAALRKAIQLRPRYSAARYNLGVTYLKLKNKKAAMQQYESLKEFDGGAAEALRKEIEKAS